MGRRDQLKAQLAAASEPGLAPSIPQVVVGRAAAIGPGEYGAIAFTVPTDTAAGEIQVQVAGRILADLPDGTPTMFHLRTASVPIAPPSA